MVEEQDAFLCYVPIFFLQGSGALSGSLQAIIILYSPVTLLRCSKWLYVHFKNNTENKTDEESWHANMRTLTMPICQC